MKKILFVLRLSVLFYLIEALLTIFISSFLDSYENNIQLVTAIRMCFYGVSQVSLLLVKAVVGYPLICSLVFYIQYNYINNLIKVMLINCMTYIFWSFVMTLIFPFTIVFIKNIFEISAGNLFGILIVSTFCSPAILYKIKKSWVVPINAMGEIDLSGLDLRNYDLSNWNLFKLDIQELSTNKNYIKAKEFVKNHPGEKMYFRLILNDADLSGANLSGTNLSGSELKETNLHGAILNNSDLSKTKLSNSDFDNVDFQNVDFNKSDFDDSKISTSNFSNTNFKSARLTGSEFKSCHFENANFEDCDIQGVKFIDSTGLTEQQLQKARNSKDIIQKLFHNKENSNDK